MNDTLLMTRIFSDETSDSERKELMDAIEEARENGQSEINDGDNHLVLAHAGDGKVAIEDINNDGEVTIADPDGSGNNILTNYDDEPDAAVEDEGEDEDGNETFSLKYGPFDSPEEAAAYDNSLQFGQYTFSDEEVASIEDKANELEGDYNKMINNPSEDLADQVKSTAEYLKSYSHLAEVHGGHDMSDLIEMCQIYSDEADAVKDAIEDQELSETPVRDYLEAADPEEIEELDDDTKEAMQKALEDEEETGETATFSDVIAYLNTPESPYDRSFTDYLAGLDEGELTEMMSQFSDVETEIIQNAVDMANAGYYDASFSDVNDAIFYANTATVTRTFSDDMTDEEKEDWEENATPNQKELRDAIMEAEANGDTVNYSDAMAVLMYSEDELDEAENNADEVAKAAQDLEENPDEELAKKVKVLADHTSDELGVANAAGFDTTEGDSKVDYANSVANSVLGGDSDDDDDEDDDDDDDDDDDSVTVSHEESMVKNSITTPMGSVEFTNGNPTAVETYGRGGEDDDDDDDESEGEQLYSDVDTRSFSSPSSNIEYLNTVRLD